MIDAFRSQFGQDIRARRSGKRKGLMESIDRGSDPANEREVTTLDIRSTFMCQRKTPRISERCRPETKLQALALLQCTQ